MTCGMVWEEVCYLGGSTEEYLSRNVNLVSKKVFEKEIPSQGIYVVSTLQTSLRLFRHGKVVSGKYLGLRRSHRKLCRLYGIIDLGKMSAVR